LAHACEGRLGEGGKLDAPRFAQLVAACRAAKEALLGPSAPDSVPVTVLGSGSSLVGAAQTTRLGKDDVERTVLDAFFPVVAENERPARARGALVALGLPYERDPAITRHIAAFLAAHASAADRPSAVLLNGGVFRATRIAERIGEVLSAWRGAPVTRLPGADPDLAVARGAVAYARARLGRGVRIGGGAARSYFIGVAGGGEAPSPSLARAVCVLPRGAEEGAVHVARGRTFALALGRPVRFDLFASDVVDAAPGDVVDVDDERFARLPPLSTTLATAGAGGSAPREAEVSVVLEGELSAIGTVDLACVEVARPDARRFRLAFQLRGDAPDRSPAPAPEQPSETRGVPRGLRAALDRIESTFGKPRPDGGGREAKDLLRDLERILGARSEWSLDVDRALFDALAENARARRRSPDHERAFWLIAGWVLRPGFGDPGDPRRVAALAPMFDERLAFPAESRGWQHYWIAWRRVAGGLDEATQMKIRDFVDPYLAPPGAGLKRPKKPAASLDDALDMAGALERVVPARRAELGGWILERTWTDRDPRLWTTLGRLGARVPAYAGVHHVVPPLVAERWLDHLLREKWDALPTASSAAVLLARRTGDRARDVGDRVRRDVEARLVAAGARDDQLRMVREVVPALATERASFFGDALPPGLKLVE
ncbi:MAG: heat-shock protein Hsp70, partial [Polyangiaceae bacterium]|nr:heat-shock protein Hsp70 [Polyangiaceae bacterium]